MFAYKKFGAAAVAATALLVTAASAGAAQSANPGAHLGNGHEVFVQTDNLSGNTIAVYDRSPDGTLIPAGTYATGGDGGQLAGSVVDHLASQNSLAYNAATRELFAVNAGSDTISVFQVGGGRLHLRQVISSGGTFPASVAINGDLVYVLNSTGGGSIQGFRLSGGELSPIAGSWRSLGLSPTATPQFVNTPGDIAFSPNGSQLLVTTKANTDAIDVFAIDSSGQPSQTPVINTEPGQVPFALAFTGQQLNVAQAGSDSVAGFTLNGDGTLTPTFAVATGGLATCWLVADGSALFAGNAASATETSILASPTGGLSVTATTATDPGTVDAAATPDGRYLYVQTGRNGVVDEFSVGASGSLTELGSVTVPNGAGGEGIATS
jgi:6-phosphogluconolactonase (cycloisomerase 2 family)